MNRLSAELFQQIVASLRSDRSLRNHEKRTRPRVGLRSSLEVIPCGRGGKRFVVTVRDLSADGIGLVSNVVMQVGQEFVAHYERQDREPLRVQYTVAYCKTISSGLYSVGARLVRVLPAELAATPAAPAAAQKA